MRIARLGFSLIVSSQFVYSRLRMIIALYTPFGSFCFFFTCYFSLVECVLCVDYLSRKSIDTAPCMQETPDVSRNLLSDEKERVGQISPTQQDIGKMTDVYN